MWVDGDLSADCTGGDYDSSSHDCSGDEGNAYDTVAEAISNADADDVIGIRGASGGFDGSYESATTRTISKNLTLEAYGSEEPIIHGTQVPTENEDWQTFVVNGSADVTFDGLEIHGTRVELDEDFGHNGISGDTSGRITINNCEIHSYNHCGIKGSSKLTMTDSYIHDIGSVGDIWNDHGVYWTRNGSLGDVVIERNRFDGITGAPFHFYKAGETCGNFIVRYNTIIGGSVNDNTTWGILLACSNCLIYNNSIYGVRWGIIFYQEACEDNDIFNNAIHGSSATDFSCDTAGGSAPIGLGNVLANNYYTTGTDCSSDPPENIDVAVPPNVFDEGTNPFIAVPDTWDDFRLAADSGAIDAGDSTLGASHKWGFDPADTTWPPSILDQDLYGDDWEIGAFVYVP